MAQAPTQEQRLELEGFARLPDELKTNIIIRSVQRSDLYPAIGVNRACRDALWKRPRRLHIKAPIDIEHNHMNALARGILRATRQRAKYKTELAASQGSNHRVWLVFTSAGDQAAGYQFGAGGMQELQTTRIGLVLHSMDTDAHQLLTRLDIMVDFNNNQLRLPTLPSLFQLCVRTEATHLTREFFSRLDLPKLGYLWVVIPNTISLEHVIPSKSMRLRCITLHADHCYMDAEHVPSLPELTELNAPMHLSMEQLVSLTEVNFTSLQTLTVRELVVDNDIIDMPAASVGEHLGALKQVHLSGRALPLSLVARLKLVYGVEVSIKPRGTVLALVGHTPGFVDGLNPYIDELITDLSNVVLPALMLGPKPWDDEAVFCFQPYLTSVMIQMFVSKGWLRHVQLLIDDSPKTAQELCDHLRQLRVCTPPEVPMHVHIVCNLPAPHVAQLVEQCWPGLPQERWSNTSIEEWNMLGHES